jgi:hypothetical protein
LDGESGEDGAGANHACNYSVEPVAEPQFAAGENCSVVLAVALPCCLLLASARVHTHTPHTRARTHRLSHTGSHTGSHTRAHACADVTKYCAETNIPGLYTRVEAQSRGAVHAHCLYTRVYTRVEAQSRGAAHAHCLVGGAFSRLPFNTIWIELRPRSA